MTFNSVFYSLTPQALLALTGYGEAATEGSSGILAVMNVIKNRAGQPQTYADQTILKSTSSLYHAVILKPYQFSVFNQSDPNRPKMESIARNFNSTLLINPTLSVAYSLAKDILSGSALDNTHGATHYHTAQVRPSWAKDIPVIGQIGNHVFYGVSRVWAAITQNSVQWDVVGVVVMVALWIFLKRERDD